MEPANVQEALMKWLTMHAAAEATEFLQRLQKNRDWGT
jgi:hypothetical protein